MKMIAGVALAAVMACGLGAVQRAEAAPVTSFFLSGSGVGFVKFSSEEPGGRNQFAVGSGNGLVSGEYYEGFPDPPYASGDYGISVQGVGQGFYSDFGNGYIGFDQYFDNNTKSFSGAGYYNNFSDTSEKMSGTFSFTGLKYTTRHKDGYTIFDVVSGKGYIVLDYNYYLDGFDGTNFLHNYYHDEQEAFISLDNISGTITTVGAVPLPASAPLFGAALLALCGIGYARRWNMMKPA